MDQQPEISPAPEPVTGLKRVANVVVRFGPVGALLVTAAAMYATGAASHLSLSQLGQSYNLMQSMTRAHPLLSLLVYELVFCFLVAVCVPASLPLSLVAGYLFGVVEGGIAADVGATLGAGLALLVCRTAAKDLVARRAGPFMARLDRGLKRGAFYYTLSLRLAPVTPTLVVNVAAGVFGLPMRPFLAGTFLGLAPASFIYAGLGSGLGQMFAAGRRPDMKMLMQPQIVLSMLGLCALAIIPAVYGYYRVRREALATPTP